MAAVSTATGLITAYYIAAKNHVSSKNYPVSASLSFSSYFDAQLKQRRRLIVIKNSSDESATTTEADSETPVEVQEGPPSLISALNVDRALRGLAITDTDHYGRLGLQTGCSYDQVTTAYKNKVAEVMNRGLDEEELRKELELLKESHSILSSVEERRLYDWSLARSGKAGRYVWPFEVDITQTITGTPPPRVNTTNP
ncbi:hypothetical protein PHJA_001872700 [Phtheirospermum japonicum]|uniref:Uncharacterized protein n=1 Tax=Phtheirospermum japonicum TaxID=374723 RepID=A0A830CDM3_9LAMI|nr:hypothetical protein PHJA_001872700 [Phtheirospermum japonicum]